MRKQRELCGGWMSCLTYPTCVHTHYVAVATVVPQAFERFVQLLQALEESGASESVGLSVPGLAALLGQQAPTR